MISSGFFSGAGYAFPHNSGTAAQEPARYSFSLENGKFLGVGGMTVNVNERGDIWGAVYDSGAEVRHNDNYSMARGVNSSLWLGDRTGMWHPLD